MIHDSRSERKNHLNLYEADTLAEIEVTFQEEMEKEEMHCDLAFESNVDWGHGPFYEGQTLIGVLDCNAGFDKQQRIRNGS